MLISNIFDAPPPFTYAEATLDAIADLIRERWPDAANARWLPGGEWVLKRQWRDGTLVGDVSRFYAHTWTWEVVGTFQIAFDGHVVRFPMLPPDLIEEAEARSRAA
jgi:hypothetical protein